MKPEWWGLIHIDCDYSFFSGRHMEASYPWSPTISTQLGWLLSACKKLQMHRPEAEHQHRGLGWQPQGAAHLCSHHKPAVPPQVCGDKQVRTSLGWFGLRDGDVLKTGGILYMTFFII